MQVSLGAALQQARKAAGMSLEDLAQRTSIRPSVLRDFENDDFSKSGGETYARGHTRNIAIALGVNPAAFLELYDSEQSTVTRTMQDLLVENHVTSTYTERPRFSIKTLAIISATAICIGLVGSVVASNFSSARPASKNLAVKPSPSSSTSSKEVLPVSGLQLKIETSRGSSWIFATDENGATLFSGSMAQGESKILTASEKVIIRFGNAGAVDVWVNGKKLSSMGTVGEVVDRTFDANSAS